MVVVSDTSTVCNLAMIERLGLLKERLTSRESWFVNSMH